jgi:hypothetical protein
MELDHYHVAELRILVKFMYLRLSCKRGGGTVFQRLAILSSQSSCRSLSICTSNQSLLQNLVGLEA